MTVTIARRLQTLEAMKPRRTEHFVLSEPGESAADALRRCGFDPEKLPGFMLVLPAKRAREEATNGKP